jgi:small subunit ribosomal protein S1
VHISELATHHVENPREVVQQGETLRAKIIEMDAERRRLSLSLKRVEEGEAARPGVGEDAPDLGLSEEVFVEDASGDLAVEVDVEAVEVDAAEVDVVDEVVEVEPEPELEPEPEPEPTIADEAEPEAAPEPGLEPEAEVPSEPDPDER